MSKVDSLLALWETRIFEEEIRRYRIPHSSRSLDGTEDLTHPLLDPSSQLYRQLNLAERWTPYLEKILGNRRAANAALHSSPYVRRKLYHEMLATFEKAQLNPLCWHVGIINRVTRKYLSSEFFSRRATAAGVGLTKKQVWLLEPESDTAVNRVFIRNFEGLYLTTDEFSNVRCMGLLPSEAKSFEIEVTPCTGAYANAPKQRYWRFKAADGSGYLTGGDSGGLKFVQKPADNGDQWLIHLAIHPQATLKNVARNKYARYINKEFRADLITPWGSESLITFEFVDGAYAIRGYNGNYLTKNGFASESLAVDCLFSLEYHRGNYVFRDKRGWLITCSGPTGLLTARAQTISKNEMFTVEDSLPQVCLVASNGKKVSARGVDVVANKEVLSDYETFQMEYEPLSGRYRFKTIKETYLHVTPGSFALQTVEKRNNDALSLFELVWQPDGSVGFKVQTNGKWVTTRANGYMYGTAADSASQEKFFLFLVNRPILILRSPHGYMGVQSPTNPVLECHHSCPDAFICTPAPKGGVYLKGCGKYLAPFEGLVVANSPEPSEFKVTLRGSTKISLQDCAGNFLKSSAGGTVTADGKNGDDNILWEISGKSPGF